MTEELAIDMPPQEKKPSHKRRNIIIAAFCGLVALAALMSWWLANGRVSSVAASVDTVVYTVESSSPGRLEKLYANPGMIVTPGQLLGRIEPEGGKNAPHIPTQEERLANAEKAERTMAARIEEARLREDGLRGLWQERVTEHVRAQLRMRSLDRRNHAAYEQAQREEAAARHRMDAAKDEFEQFSQMRAAMNAQHEKMRMEVMARKRKGGMPPIITDPVELAEANAPKPGELYSPINGRILRVTAVPGQPVREGQAIFLIMPSSDASRDDYWIQAWFPLDDKGKIEPGQTVSIKAARNGAHFNGKVAAISDEPQVLPNTAGAAGAQDSGKYAQKKYLPVRVSFDYPQDARSLELGAKVDCQIQTRYVPGMGLFQ